MLLFPWYLKAVYGFLSDNFRIGRFGRRKPFLIFAALLSFYGWTTLELYKSVNLGFIISALALALGSAISDTVIDGLGVELTPTEYISRLQGTSWAGRGIGIGMTGIVSSLLVKYFGWKTMIDVSAFFGIAMVFSVLILPESPVSANLNLRNSLSSISSMLSGSISKLLYILFSGASLTIIPLFSFLLNNDLGYPVENFAIPSFLFSIGVFFGSYSMAYLFIKNETKAKILLIHLLFLTTIVFGMIAAELRYPYLVNIFFVASGFGTGLVESYQLKVIQELSPEDVESTAFAIWTGISNVGQFIVGGIVFSQISKLLKLELMKVIQLTHICVIFSIIALFKFKFHENRSAI